MADFSETFIQRHSSPESFRRGQEYYRQGSVSSLLRRGRELRAEVVGSRFAPYDVRVVSDEAGIVGASCSCPYDWGGLCKHVVAALLACVHDPGSVRELPALEEVLRGLEKEELQDLLLRLAERHPSLAGIIEGELALPAGPEPRPVDAEAIRRRLRAGIQAPGYAEPYDDWHPSGDLGEARRVLEGAWGLIRADDARGALSVLEAIIEEYLESPDAFDWGMMGDYGGELLDLLEEVGATLTEALLSVELSPDEGEDYGAKLDVWWGELGDYGAGDAFGAAFRAVEQGWSYPPLERVLEGEVPDDDFFEELYDDPLTIARLGVLQHRGRYQEYLRLSEAAGEDTSHAVMLALLDRAEEAVAYASRRLSAPEEALAVAEALRERGRAEEALRVGERGLSLEGPKSRLAGWVRDLAEGLGRCGIALEAAVAALHADPDLVSYRRVQELAGERWPEHRERLLDHLRHSNASYLPTGEVEVFLHENLTGDAIAAVEGKPAGPLVARVADAAIESHPDWVIETCRRLAEEIMNEGRSGRYDEAVSWLAKAREAHISAGRAQEWRAYLEELIVRHRRKYKLRPMLEDLAKQ